MVLLTALILLAMLGLLLTSALRNTTVALHEAHWSRIEASVAGAVEHQVRQSLRDLLAGSWTAHAERAFVDSGVQMVVRIEDLGSAAATASRVARDCMEVDARGSLENLEVRQAVLVCRDPAGSSQPLTAWREWPR